MLLKNYIAAFSILILSLIIGGQSVSAQIAGQKIGQIDDSLRIGRTKLIYAKPVAQKIKFTMTDISKPDVDLTDSINNFKLKIRAQGSRNTCSVHALTFLMEYEYAKQNLGLVTGDLSEEYLNYATNVAANNQNDGDFFFNVNKGYQKYGQVMQTFVPNKTSFDANFKVEQKYLEMGNNVPRLKPFVIKENSNFTADTKDDANPFGLTDAQINSIIAEINNDHPVAVGFRWFGEGKFATETVFGVELLKNVPVSDLTGGHSVALVGYRKHKNYPGGGYFIFRNSWGETFGNKGYGYLSFEFAKAHAADAMSYH